MAYRKYKKNYKKSRSRSNAMCKPTVYGSAAYLAQQALRGVKQLRGIINSELHRKDSIASTTVGTGGYIFAVSSITQGDLYDNRQGNSVLVKSLNIQGNVKWDTSATDSALTMWVIIDTQQASDTTPSIADIFNGQGPHSILNAQTVGRYKILLKKHYSQDSSKQLVFIDEHMTMNHHVRYNGASHTDIQKGGIYVIFISNQTTYTPTFSVNTRISYYDN